MAIGDVATILVYWLRKLIWILGGRGRLSRVNTPASDDRTIRLFVSSTFQDMQDERRTLQEEVIPIVRRRLLELGVTFVGIDLRWGITREEAESGKVLDICLQEIDHCRPWVLGILGARYGWIDPAAPRRLNAEPRFSRLLSHGAASLTELELRHAITDRPPDTPEPAALIFTRVPDVGSTSFGVLATELEAGGTPIRLTPPDLQSFAKVVRDDLVALATSRIPHRHPTSSAQLMAEHRMEDERHRFVRRPELLQLYRRACGPTGRIALIGPEGCGKSALMAAAARLIAAEGRTRVVAAFAPGGFRNRIGALKSVLAQLGDQGTTLSGPASLARQFHEALASASSFAPLCILIDDIDMDPEATDELAWLPDAVPNTVIVVGLRGGNREAFWARSRGYKVMRVGYPSRQLAGEMIERSLLLRGRRLDADQLERLISQPRSVRDYLIVSEELRQTQRFEDLDSTIDELTAFVRPEALASRALQRILGDRSWATNCLLALAVSENGLADETLQQIAREAGGRGAPLDIRILREAIGDYATEIAGRTLIINPAFRDAVLVSHTAADRMRARRTVTATCLASLDAPGSAEEILIQVKELGDWPHLVCLLAKPDLAEILLRRAPEPFAAAWSEALTHGAPPPERIYAEWAGSEAPARVALVAEFLVVRGATAVAGPLAADALARSAGDDGATRVRAHLVLARAAETMGRLEVAEQHCMAVSDLGAVMGAGAIRALAAANALRLAFLRDGAGAVQAGVDAVRRLACEYPDGRALATVTLLEGLAALEGGDLKTARKCFEDLKKIALRDDDLLASASAEAGLARTDLARGRRKSAERRARTVGAVGEVLGDTRLALEGLAIRTAIAIDDAAGFGQAQELIASRRARAGAAGDELALIEADMDEAILFAGNAGLRSRAHEHALRALEHARALRLHRIESKILGLLGADGQPN